METRRKKLRKAVETLNMETCNRTTEYSYSIENVSEDSLPSSKSLIHILNDDCLVHIFEYLQIKDKFKIERVCRHWQNISKDAWRNERKIDGSEALWGFKICKKNRSGQTKIFKRVLERCGRFLTHIDFSNFDIGDDILRRVGRFCTNLEFVDAEDLKWTYKASKALTVNCHKLKTLSIGSCADDCNDECLSELFFKNQNLKFFSLCDNYNINGKCLLSLPAESIETIILENCPRIAVKHLARAVKDFHKLRTLTINSHSPSKNREDTITLPESLSELQLTRYIYTTMDLSKLTLLTKLESLDISQANVTDEFLLILAKNCTNISELHMNGCREITDVGVQTITRLLKIEVLSLRYTTISDQALKYSTTLKKLHCAMCVNVEDDGICKLIVSNENIEILDFFHCRKITNRVLKQAINFIKARKNDLRLKIDLRGTSVETCKIPEIPSYLCLLLACRGGTYPDVGHNLLSQLGESNPSILIKFLHSEIDVDKQQLEFV